MDGNGTLSFPSNLKDLWMSEGELVNVFHVTAPKLISVVRTIYKEGMFRMSDVQQKQETDKVLEKVELASHNHITFIRHNKLKETENSVSFNYLIRPSFLRRLIKLFQPSERLSAFCFVFSKFQ